MREITSAAVTEKVAELFIQANYVLNEDVVKALEKAAAGEESESGREVLKCLLENASIAARGEVPLCQDCGTALVFLDIGQDLHIVGGDLYQAVNTGVKSAYEKGYLRKSMLDRPFSSRINTGDNTPAVIFSEIVSGDHLKITVLPKGGGSENMSRLKMLTPADGRSGIVDFVTKSVEEAGSNPCPPLIVGVGIGGTAELSMLMAKKALLRPLAQPSTDPEIASLESDLLTKINNLGIGPMGYGGRFTALAVNIEVRPTHLASLPVAVNLSCHSARHKEATI